MSKLLRVGDTLKEKDLKAWTLMGKNRIETGSITFTKGSSEFVGDRVVESIPYILGNPVYIVSGTAGQVGVRAEGYIGNNEFRGLKMGELKSKMRDLKEVMTEERTKNRMTFNFGDKFLISGDKFLLSKVGSGAVLINMQTGKPNSGTFFLVTRRDNTNQISLNTFKKLLGDNNLSNVEKLA